MSEFCKDTPKNQYCLNCSYSYVIDEDDKLYCPFHGSEPIQNDEWCKEWKNDEKLRLIQQLLLRCRSR